MTRWDFCHLAGIAGLLVSGVMLALGHVEFAIYVAVLAGITLNAAD